MPFFNPGEAHRFIAHRQLADVAATASDLIVEPGGRNTATVGGTVAFMRKEVPDTVLAGLPCDSMIVPERAFRCGLEKAHRLAVKGAIGMLGIRHHHAATRFGYLKAEGGKEDALMISELVENPDVAPAVQMPATGTGLGIRIFFSSGWMLYLLRSRPMRPI